MKTILVLSSIRTFMVASLTLACVSVFAQDGSAQLFKKSRLSCGHEHLVQYAPDDPVTRGRLFNFQTGHAGAFYNCDGEECKRNSPYIFWTQGYDDVYCPLCDVVQFRRDRCKIAQRICDGSCCGQEQVAGNQSCGCSECSGGSSTMLSLAKKAAGKTSNRTVAKSKSLLRPRAGAVGLVEARKITQPVRKIAAARTAKATAVSEKQCDCLTCRVKKQRLVQRETPAAKSVFESRSNANVNANANANANANQRKCD